MTGNFTGCIKGGPRVAQGYRRVNHQAVATAQANAYVSRSVIDAFKNGATAGATLVARIT